MFPGGPDAAFVSGRSCLAPRNENPDSRKENAQAVAKYVARFVERFFSTLSVSAVSVGGDRGIAEDASLGGHA